MIKKKLLCTIECPWCNKAIKIIKETEVITPAEPADKMERFYGSKVTQRKLEG